MLTLRAQRAVSGLLVAAIAAPMLLQAACGTLIHPERRGQSGGKLDPAIVILDGIGLLFFIIPGLIAFAVDFSTGAIYLPDEDGESSVLHMDPAEMTAERIAAVIHERTGLEVVLTEEDLREARSGGGAMAYELNGGR